MPGMANPGLDCVVPLSQRSSNVSVSSDKTDFSLADYQSEARSEFYGPCTSDGEGNGSDPGEPELEINIEVGADSNAARRTSCPPRFEPELCADVNRDAFVIKAHDGTTATSLTSCDMPAVLLARNQSSDAGSSPLEVVLRNLELRLQALHDVPVMLRALQDVPRQLHNLTSKVTNIQNLQAHEVTRSSRPEAGRRDSLAMQPTLSAPGTPGHKDRKTGARPSVLSRVNGSRGSLIPGTAWSPLVPVSHGNFVPVGICPPSSGAKSDSIFSRSLTVESANTGDDGLVPPVAPLSLNSFTVPRDSSASSNHMSHAAWSSEEYSVGCEASSDSSVFQSTSKRSSYEAGSCEELPEGSPRSPRSPDGRPQSQRHVPRRKTLPTVGESAERKSVSTTEPPGESVGNRPSLTSSASEERASLMQTVMQLSRQGTRRLSVDSSEGVTKNYFRRSPTSPYRLAWDAVLILNTILAGIIIPLQVVYDGCYKPFQGLDAVLLAVDIFWSFDLVLNFRTGFFSDGDVEYDVYAIAARYMRGWLLLDLVALWPLALAASEDTAYVVLCFAKAPRLAQAGSRFMRIHASYLNDRLLPVGIVLLAGLGTHMMACFWHVSLVADGWTDPDITATTKYVNDVYFVSTTLTSVGFGDIVPVGNVSKIFSIIMMLVGSAVFGAIVSVFSIILHKYLNDELGTKLAEITHFMKRRSVPNKVQIRVRDNLRQCFVRTDGTAIPALLACLSPGMRRELSLRFISSTYIKFPLFQHAQRSFVAELAQAQRWEQIMQGDLVADEGQAVQELVFVMEGGLMATITVNANGLDMSLTDAEILLGRVSDPGDSSSPQSSMSSPPSSFAKAMMDLPRGSWFGEASLFGDRRVYTSVIMAETKSELSILGSMEYNKCIQLFPWLSEKHQLLKEALSQGRKSYDDLKYKEAEVDMISCSGIKPKAWSLFQSLSTTRTGCSPVVPLS